MAKGLGLEYWAAQAELRDEPQQAAEIRAAARAQVLLGDLVSYLRNSYDEDMLDGTTLNMMDEAGNYCRRE